MFMFILNGFQRKLIFFCYLWGDGKP